MQALNLVLTAVRQQRGEEGVFDALNAAREEYGLQAHANPIRQQREQQQQQAMLQHDADDDRVGSLMSSLSLHPAFSSYPMPSRPPQQQRQQDEDADMDDDEDEGGGERQSSDDDAATSILEEHGQGLVLDAALRDQETYRRCGRCGGLIARDRWAAHVSLWCDAAISSSGGGGRPG